MGRRRPSARGVGGKNAAFSHSEKEPHDFKLSIRFDQAATDGFEFMGLLKRGEVMAIMRRRAQ